MNLPRFLRDALHRRYCCECSAWGDLALAGWEDEEPTVTPDRSGLSWEPVETPTGTVQFAVDVMTVVPVDNSDGARHRIKSPEAVAYVLENSLPWTEDPS